MASMRLLLLTASCLTLLAAGFQYSDDDGVIPYSTIRLRRRLYAKRRHRNICDLDNDARNNVKLREIIRNSDYVFTGKVLSYVSESEGNGTNKWGERGERKEAPRSKRRKVGPSAEESNSIDVGRWGEEPARTFSVEVKRVMKGADSLGRVQRVVVRVPKDFVSGVEVTSDSVLNTNCIEFHPVLKVRQTAILLAKRAGNGTVELTYFPVAMTLRHLDRVDAAVTENYYDSKEKSSSINYVAYREYEGESYRKERAVHGGTGAQNVVVNLDNTGNSVSSVLGNGRFADHSGAEVAESSGGCCLSGLCPTNSARIASTYPQMEDTGMCRPSLLLCLLVLLIVVFICVSAVLLYLNYAVFKPRPQIIEDKSEPTSGTRKTEEELSPVPTGTQSEPCETTFCSFGSTCVTESDGRTHCKCPTTCPTGYSPVCGTDGAVYTNECVLRMTTCQKQLSVKILHEGECEQEDPCKEKKCPFGARCIPSPDGKSAECKCPENCPSLGDHIGSRPVCGSDGLDYRDLCELRRTACLANTEITVKYQGKCDPCENVQCPEPEICQLDSDRQPECKCGESCSLEFTPVCGSDGKTYSNECSLRQESCRTRKTLRIIYRGKCSSGHNPCMALKCMNGEECMINKYGIARCECPSECEPIVRPVCGKDSKTYDNECELKKASCITKKSIEVSYTGVCGGDGPCSAHSCSHGAVCVERGGKPSCECPSCPSEFDPVCGSDGISYGNECKLRLEACQHRRDISVLYSGLCNGCENKKCEFYAVCESDGSGDAKCVCPSNCPEGTQGGPVCGSDGHTYASECELRMYSCRTKQLVNYAYKGDCDLCQGVKCKYGARCEAGECVCPTNCSHSEPSELVCASNMVTYPNECEMQKASCEQAKHLKPLSVFFFGDCREKFSVPYTTAMPAIKTNLINSDHKGELTHNWTQGVSDREKEVCKDIHCDYEASCELGPDNFPRCSCKFDCQNVVGGGKVVCASDLRIYPSLCEMKMEGCQRQEELRLRPLELCEGMEVKPCNGEPPLIDPTSQNEYDCGSGPNRQDCPSGSYCHHTKHFSKCCKKDLNTLFDNCAESWYGCCPDGKTIAQGPDNAGCPSLCGCNKLGSYGDTCEPETGQCNCKPGVGGVKCDRCEPGFWGLPKISEGHEGCLPCGCSQFGSVRDDCEQMTGRCVCKRGIQGQKCTVCTDLNKVLGPTGCVYEDQLPAVGTEWPLKRSTLHRYTEPESLSSPLYKSTRHLLVPDHRFVYNREENSQLTSASFYHMSDTSRALPWNTARNVLSYRPTPATIHITALLGDLCEITADCGVPHSECIRGSCLCPEGFMETPDRQECLSYNFYPTLVHKAYDIPSFDGKAYVQLKRLKAYNKLTIEIEFKSYANDGILLYSQQKSDGTGDFLSLAIVNGFVEFRYNLGNGAVVITSLEKIELKKFHKVTAKRYHRDGILKLDDFEDVAGQSQGNLKSLDLVEDAFVGYVPTDVAKVFENVGTTQGLMGCIRKLKIGRHTVELHEGRDQLVGKVVGVTECGENPCSTLPCNNSGTCFAIDSDKYVCNCREEYTGDNCETWLNPCLSGPCGFGSTCDPQRHGGFLCLCPPGKKGPFCNSFDVENLVIHPADFNGNSYVELPKLENVGRSFTLEIWVLARAPDGILVYNGQLANGKGDFICLSLHRGFVVFQYDLGSGPANITSSEVMSVGSWHSIKVSRTDRDGTLQVDDGVISYGSSGPPLNELNLELPLYVGGIPAGYEISKEIKASAGLIGGIQRLLVNGQLWQDLVASGHRTHNVKSFSGVPCNETCRNGGTCLPYMNYFVCKCLPGFEGDLCDSQKKISVTASPIRLSRESYLEFPSKITKNMTNANITNTGEEYEEDEYDDSGFEDYDDDIDEDDDYGDMFDDNDGGFFPEGKKAEFMNHYEIIMKTHTDNGLLLWLGKAKSPKADYMSIAIVDGYVQFSFKLAQQNNSLFLTSQVFVSDNKWHTIVVHRRKKRGYVQVDNETPVRGVADSTSLRLRGGPRLFIGGAPLLPSGLPEEYYEGFYGCLESVKVDKKRLDIMNNRKNTEFCHDNEV